jgi:outer membrane protein assembly factor BamB
MVAIDIRRGARAWDITLAGVEMPWVSGDFVFVLTNDAKVVCLTRREGRVRWALPLERYGDPEELEDPIVWLGPVLAGDRLIVVGSNRQALSISPYTGELLGTVELPGAPAVAPVVAQEMLFVLTEDANLIVMR